MIFDREVENLLDISHTKAKKWLKEIKYPYEILDKIGDIIMEIGSHLQSNLYNHPQKDVWIAKNAVISDKATLEGPLIIDSGTEVRPGAYLRGKTLVGEGCVIGNSTEIKNAILLDGAKAPHLNYVGDSILGYKAHMGAGSVTSNVKLDESPVSISYLGECLQTGRKKCGAVLGDYAEIGCHAVLNPGTIIGRHTVVYPLSSVRGWIDENSIYKDVEHIIKKK